MEFTPYLIAYVIAVVALTGAFYIDLPGVRAAAVAVGAVAIWLPFIILESSLSLPNPNPLPGQYRLLGKRIDERTKVIYMLIADYTPGDLPRMYSMAVNLEDATTGEVKKEPYKTGHLLLEVGQDGSFKLKERVDDVRLDGSEKDEYYRSRAAIGARGTTPPQEK